MGTEAGTIAAILGLTTAMLGALVAAYKMLADFYKTALANCNTEKATCYAENKVTIDKAYSLVSAFGDLKTVTIGSAEKINKIERALEDLQRDLSRRRES